MTDQLQPNLLEDHECGGLVNEDGRVLINCSQCYEDLYADARYSGYLFALNDIQKTLTEIINAEFPILKADSEKDIIEKWKSAQVFNKLLDSAVDKLNQKNNARHEELRKKWLRRVQPDQ